MKAIEYGLSAAILLVTVVATVLVASATRDTMEAAAVHAAMRSEPLF